MSHEINDRFYDYVDDLDSDDLEKLREQINDLGFGEDKYGYTDAYYR